MFDPDDVRCKSLLCPRRLRSNAQNAVVVFSMHARDFARKLLSYRGGNCANLMNLL